MTTKYSMKLRWNVDEASMTFIAMCKWALKMSKSLSNQPRAAESAGLKKEKRKIFNFWNSSFG